MALTQARTPPLLTSAAWVCAYDATLLSNCTSTSTSSPFACAVCGEKKGASCSVKVRVKVRVKVSVKVSSLSVQCEGVGYQVSGVMPQQDGEHLTISVYIM